MYVCHNAGLPDSASYVSLRVKTAPDKNRKTRAKPSDTNPTWQDCFTFLLDEKKENILGENTLFCTSVS